MMTQAEFIEITNRAERYYEKQYSSEQLKIMYEELKNIDANRYRRIITTVIRTHKFAPKIADILETNIDLPPEERSNRDIKKCNKCNGTGYILYTKSVENGEKKIKYLYGAVCNCGNDTRYDGNKCKRRSEFYIPTAVELNLI